MPFIVATCVHAAAPERGFAPPRGGRTRRRPSYARSMLGSPSNRRFEGAPAARVCGVEVPVAVGRTRLLGLARLDRAEAGAGLLIPRCAAVHTFGMRFELDVVFLDDR